MSVLRLNRRPPPQLPLRVFGPEWGGWITKAANAAACPPDSVAANLLASASALIGNARWAQATLGWAEPPHLWCGSVSDSGCGKSPGGGCSHASSHGMPQGTPPPNRGNPHISPCKMWLYNGNRAGDRPSFTDDVGAFGVYQMLPGATLAPGYMPSTYGWAYSSR
jgi:hypothetical protein